MVGVVVVGWRWLDIFGNRRIRIDLALAQHDVIVTRENYARCIDDLRELTALVDDEHAREHFEQLACRHELNAKGCPP